MFLSYKQDEEFERICGRHHINLFANISIIRNGEVISKKGFMNFINLKSENLRRNDRIKIIISSNTALIGFRACPSRAILLNKEFEFITR